MSWENILKDSSQSTWSKLWDERRNLRNLSILISKLTDEKMVRELPQGEKRNLPRKLADAPKEINTIENPRVNKIIGNKFVFLLFIKSSKVLPEI